MPELPEVEVVRAGLAPAVSGATVQAVDIYDARSLRRHDVASGAFDRLLIGRRLTGAVRRGKFLWMPIAAEAAGDPDHALVAHLGMSGQLLLREPGTRDDRHLRVRLSLEHPEFGELWLNFADQRIFGSMSVDRLVETSDGLPGGFGSESNRLPVPVAHIARDSLDPAFDDRAFVASLRARHTGLKRALLDQTLVSGVGNIYADESLWAAQLHFARPTATLTRAQSLRLLAELRIVLSRALAEGGTSFSETYVNVNGASGYFSHSLNVYGQQGKPCPRCGRPIVREQFMNRSSHLCVHCQRLPRATLAHT